MFCTILIWTWVAAALRYFSSIVAEKNEVAENFKKKIGTLECEERKYNFRQKMISMCPEERFEQKKWKISKVLTFFRSLSEKILAGVVKTAFYWNFFWRL